MITFHQECTIYETGRDGYGKPIKMNMQTLKCRVKEKYQMVKNQAAQEIVSQLEFTLPPNAQVSVNHIIGYEGKEYAIISLKITRNTIGEVVKKVVFV